MVDIQDNIIILKSSTFFCIIYNVFGYKLKTNIGLNFDYQTKKLYIIIIIFEYKVSFCYRLTSEISKTSAF